MIEEKNSLMVDNNGENCSLSSMAANDFLFFEFKQLQIEKSLENNDRLALKTSSVSIGGFINNSLRVKVWYKMIIGDESVYNQAKHKSVPNEIIQQNENYRQVILDVERSLKRFPPSVKEAQRISYQDSLTNVIIMILAQNPSLYYYQGYHDICLTFLLIMDQDKAFTLLNRISLTHLKHFMERTMNTTSNLLEIIYLLLKDEDQALHDYLIKSEVGTIFSLSWVITWFSHVLNDLDDILRLFDLFISTHFLMPIYMTVSILRYKKDDILLIDCDMASMHRFLTNIPQQEQLPIDRLVHESLLLTVKYPPEDTLSRQRQMEDRVLKKGVYGTFNHNPIKFVLKRSCQIFGRNIFSIGIIGLLTALVYRFWFDYFYSD